MINVYDITDFGAVGNGSVDCTKAIQSAIDEAAKVKGAVIVPPGKYLCGYIKLKPSVTLEGYHGWGYREMGGSALVLNDKKAPCLLDMTGAFGACVKGIQFNGNKLMGKNIHGIMLNWHKYNGGSFDDGYFDDNLLLEPTHSEFREDNFVICDCQCKNFSGDGIHLNRIFAFTVSDCQLMSNNGDGIYVNGWDGWIHDCIIHTNNGAGIGSSKCDSDGNVVFASVTMTGNRIEWNKGGGMNFYYTHSLNINSNFYDRNGGPAIKFGKGGNSLVTVNANVFRRNGKKNWGDFANEYDNSHIYMDSCSNISVTGNSFEIGQDDGHVGEFNPQYGIVINNTKKCVISSNTLYKGSIVDAIKVLAESEDNLITNNIF